MKSHDINWLRFLPYHPPGWFRPNVRVAEPGLKTWKPCAKSHARRSHQSGFRSKSTPYQRLLYIYIYIVPKWILDPSLSKLLISVFLDIWWSMMIYGYIYMACIWSIHTCCRAEESTTMRFVSLCVLADGFIGKPFREHTVPVWWHGRNFFHWVWSVELTTLQGHLRFHPDSDQTWGFKNYILTLLRWHPHIATPYYPHITIPKSGCNWIWLHPHITSI